MKLLFLGIIAFILLLPVFSVHLSLRNEINKSYCLLFESNITGTLHYEDEVCLYVIVIPRFHANLLSRKIRARQL
ncbi:hypothetical protein Mgra_00008894 [Meloidogyne graminicola]|uniref:Uncharacterized protein n=1 Tax=Meloidogyne graminicola TaxID=189291 RepID=A0A8S9ZEL3_9BILA|nr:hypothetical protein Mgra_00008894 [Meloidogyne graminicola]